MRDQATRRGIHIEHGKRLVEARPIEGAVRATFADDSYADGDILIGCDGIDSTVRRTIDLSSGRL